MVDDKDRTAEKAMPANLFMVGASGECVRVMRNTGGSLTKREALNLAAWLVAIADSDGAFHRELEAVSQ